MKKILIPAIAATLLSTSAFAKDHYYAKGLIGGGHVPNQKVSVSNGTKIKTKGHGILGILGVGYKFGHNNLRADIELYMDSGLKGKKKGTSSHKFETYAGLWNIYYDFKNQSKFTPYLQAGAGYARNKLKFNDATNSFSKSSGGFAYKLGLGSAYAISSSLDAELGYFYMNKGSKKRNLTKGSTSYQVKSSNGIVHAFTAGGRVNF